MTVKNTQGATLSGSFTAGGNEFTAEAVHTPDDSQVTISLYLNGRFVFSESEPVEPTYSESELEERVRDRALALRAQIEEMYAFLQDTDGTSNSEALLALAGLFETRGLFDEANRIYGRALSLDSENDILQYRKGLCLCNTGDFAGGAELFRKAVSSKPLYADYRNACGLALVFAGQLREGLKNLDQALELNTYYADAYYSYGLAHLFAGLKGLDAEFSRNFVGQATSRFERAVMLDDTYNTNDHRQALQRLAEGSVREAFSIFRGNRDKIQRERMPEYSHRRAEVISRISGGDRQSAITRIQSLSHQLIEHPDYTDLIYELAVAYLKLGMCDWKAGIDKLKEAVERNPDMKKAVAAHDEAYILSQEISKTLAQIESRKS